MKWEHKILVAALAIAGLGKAMAAVPPAMAEKLGGELTPFGAAKAGNADGTIPAWTGGQTQPPAS